VGKYYVGSIGACDDSYQRQWLARHTAAINDVSYSTNCQDRMLSLPGTRRRHRALHRCLGLYTALQVCWPVRLIQQSDLCMY